jgi:hypothetical protein
MQRRSRASFSPRARERDAAVGIDDDRWVRFLDHVVFGLREAERRINDEPLKSRYENRPGWFGRARKKKGGTQYPDETAISQALYEVLSEIKADQLVRAPVVDAFDLTRMEFAVEVPRRLDPGIGPRSQPTDLRIAVSQDVIDFRIEAKNVLTPGEIKSEYIGRRGLARFDDTSAPYTLERFGGMVAYVMDKDARSWSELVKTTLRNELPRERISDRAVATEVLTTTVHDREIDIPAHQISGRFRTEVIHLVLEFETRPSLRQP